MELEEKEQAVRKLWRKLNESLLLVEGKNDVSALREVGVYATIHTAVGKPERIVKKAVAEAGGRKVALMFDYDREGEHKILFYNELLYNEDCNADLQLRKQLKMLFPIHTIEDLPNPYFELMEEVALQKRVRREGPRAALSSPAFE